MLLSLISCKRSREVSMNVSEISAGNDQITCTRNELASAGQVILIHKKLSTSYAHSTKPRTESELL